MSSRQGDHSEGQREQVERRRARRRRPGVLLDGARTREGLGRSRGGLTSKTHLAANGGRGCWPTPSVAVSALPPSASDGWAHRDRNTVERAVDGLARLRAVALRTDERLCDDNGTATSLWLRDLFR